MKFLPIIALISVSANRFDNFLRHHKSRPISRPNKIPPGIPVRSALIAAQREQKTNARMAAVRREFCNAKSCAKCYKLLQSPNSYGSKMHLVCKLTYVALPKCCPKSIIYTTGW